MLVQETIVIKNRRIEGLMQSFVLRALVAEIGFYTSLLPESETEAPTQPMLDAQKIMMGLRELLLERGYSDKEIKTAIQIFQARKGLQANTNNSTIIQG